LLEFTFRMPTALDLAVRHVFRRTGETRNGPFALIAAVECWSTCLDHLRSRAG
jgi:hypothetical protein